MTLEARLINDSGPTTVLFKYTNATGASQSITDHEVFSIKDGSGKRIAAVVWASSQVATIGTLANGETGEVMVEGRLKFEKSTAVSFAQGQTAYWDYSTNKVSTAAVCDQMTDFALGRVVEAAATAADKVIVDLNAGPGAGSIGSSSSSSTSSSSSSSSSSSTSS